MTSSIPNHGSPSPFLRRATCRLVGLAVLVSATLAFADQDPGSDEITLKNGGSVRGTLVSSEPGRSVKILVLGEKDVRVIPWDQVGGLERDKFARRPATEPQATAATSSVVPPLVLPALGSPGVVRLHVESPSTVVITAHSTAYGSTGLYGFVIDAPRTVCESPCDKIVDGSSGQGFTVGGEGLRESSAFSLVSRSGDVDLRVSPGHRSVFRGGFWMLMGGLTAIVVGGTFVGLGATADPNNPAGTVGSRSWIAPGAIAAGAGLALVIGSIAMLASSQTTYTLRSATPAVRGGGARTPRYSAGEF